MPTKPPKRIKTQRAKDRWAWLENRTAGYLAESKQKDLGKLVDKILEEGGGDFVLLPIREPDLDAILARGQLWKGPPWYVVQMSHSRCHSNVAELYRARKIDAIVTGYGLSYDPDGIRLWRQHSWGLLRDRVVETTEARKLYFGVALKPGKESQDFLRGNMEI